jgi:vesicle-associated membrane protein 7
MSFFHEGTFVHYISSHSDTQTPLRVTFLVVADQSVERKAAFLLLLNVESAFKSYVKDISTLQSLDHTGHAKLAEELKRLTVAAENGEQDSLGALERELDQVKHIMIANVERLLERGERINLLVNKTDRMNANSVAFRKVSAKTRSKFWWDNVKYSALMLVVILVLIYILFGELFILYC